MQMGTSRRVLIYLGVCWLYLGMCLLLESSPPVKFLSLHKHKALKVHRRAPSRLSSALEAVQSPLKGTGRGSYPDLAPRKSTEP